jgi:hypothetical protein
MKIYKTKLGSPERASRPSAHLGVLATHFYLGGDYADQLYRAWVTERKFFRGICEVRCGSRVLDGRCVVHVLDVCYVPKYILKGG